MANIALIDNNILSDSGTALTSVVTGSGTINTLPKFTGTSTIGDSAITDSGSLITLGSNSYVNGSLGIGTTSLTGFNLRVSKNITGGTTAYGVQSDGQIQSDVTSNAHLFRSAPSTQATAFTLSSLNHYTVFPVSVGAGSAITFQRGFWVTSLTGATANYGFVGDIAAASNSWNIYMNGTANNYMAGGLGIGSTSVGNGINLNMAKTMTGATTQWNIYNQSQIQSDVTTLADYFRTNATTQAATFTLPSLVHYRAFQGTFGAGSTVTNQYGFYADASLIGATNNFGFYGAIPAGANRWNLYMAGAPNYLQGALGIGSTTLTGFNLRIDKSITGATTSYGIHQGASIQSDVTTAYINNTNINTAAASFTIATLAHYRAAFNVLGAGSAITTQYGYLVESTMSTATNNYAFYSGLTAGTGKWNLYMNGTANNYLAGNLLIGSNLDSGAKLQITGTATIVNSTAAAGLGVTTSDVNGDGVKVTHSNGRAINVQSSATGYGILVNNETLSTSFPFTVQKQGVSKIVFTDAGAGTFSNRLVADGDIVTNNIMFLRNTNSNGYGLSIQAGFGTNYSLYVANYVGSKVFEVLSNGTTSIIGSLAVTTGGIISDGSVNEGFVRIERDTVGTNTVIGSLNFTNNNGATTYGKVFGGRNSAGDGYVALGTGVSNNLYALESGNVGIGTTAPMTFGSFTNLTIASSATNNYSAIFLVNSSVSIRGSWYQNGGNQINFGTATAHPLVFDTNDVERMRITSGGVVAIGTSSNVAQTGETLLVAGDNGVNTVVVRRTGASNTNASRILFQAINASSVVQNTGIIEAGLENSSTAGYLAFFSGTTERMRLNSAGRLIVGATTDGGTGLVQIHGTARAVQLVASQGGITAGNYAIYGHDDDNGYINVVRSVFTGDFHFRFDGTTRATINRSTGVYTATSDVNKKKDIELSQIGLSEVMQLKPSLYRMKEDQSNGQKELGFIAQEVKDFIPNAYVESGDFIGLNFNPIVAALTKAVQELKAELDTLKNK